MGIEFTSSQALGQFLGISSAQISIDSARCCRVIRLPSYTTCHLERPRRDWGNLRASLSAHRPYWLVSQDFCKLLSKLFAAQGLAQEAVESRLACIRHLAVMRGVSNHRHRGKFRHILDSTQNFVAVNFGHLQVKKNDVYAAKLLHD